MNKNVQIMRHDLCRKLSKIEITLSRIRLRKAALEYKLKKRKNDFRKMEFLGKHVNPL